MVVQEMVTRYEQKNVVRCDKCCGKIEGSDRQDMEVVVFNALQHGTQKVVQKKYHLCYKCAFNMRDDFDQRRERVRMGGVTEAEVVSLAEPLTNCFHCGKLISSGVKSYIAVLENPANPFSSAVAKEVMCCQDCSAKHGKVVKL